MAVVATSSSPRQRQQERWRPATMVWTMAGMLLLVFRSVMFLTKDSNSMSSYRLLLAALEDSVVAAPNNTNTNNKQSNVLPLSHTNDCRLTVMMETNNATNYIREMVAYYLSHGAEQVILYDHTTPKSQAQLYIQKQLARWFAPSQYQYLLANESFTRHRQQAGLTQRVHEFLQNHVEYHSDKNSSSSSLIKPHWLITVDDDEYMYPSLDYLHQAYPSITSSTMTPIHNNSLLDFLCSPFLLQYPVVYFRWRYVGTSNIPQRQPHTFDLETYTAMQQPRIPNQGRRVGKSAFQLNHPKFLLAERWMAQDKFGEYKNPLKRRGGAFFLHGHEYDYRALEGHYMGKQNTTRIRETDPKNATYTQTLKIGYTYHFTRSQEEHYRRRTGFIGGGTNKKEERDLNEVNNTILADWGYRMRQAGWLS